MGLAAKCRVQFVECFGRSAEQVLGERAVLRNLAHDVAGVLVVGAHSGEVLQAQIDIAIDLCIREPAAQARRAAGVVAEEIRGVVNVYIA